MGRLWKLESLAIQCGMQRISPASLKRRIIRTKQPRKKRNGSGGAPGVKLTRILNGKHRLNFTLMSSINSVSLFQKRKLFLLGRRLLDLVQIPRGGARAD